MSESRKNAEKPRPYGYRDARERLWHEVIIYPDHTSDSALVTHAFDISSTGIGIALDEQFLPGTTVMLCIADTAATPSVRLPATVVYCAAGRCGLAFSFSSRQHEEQVRATVAKLLSWLAENKVATRRCLSPKGLPVGDRRQIQ